MLNPEQRAFVLKLVSLTEEQALALSKEIQGASGTHPLFELFHSTIVLCALVSNIAPSEFLEQILVELRELDRNYGLLDKRTLN